MDNYWLKNWPGIWQWNFEMTRRWARGKYGEVIFVKGIEEHLELVNNSSNTWDDPTWRDGI